MTQPSPRPAAERTVATPAAPAPRPRTPLRDNTRLLLLVFALLVTLAGLLALASRSSTLAPDFVAEFVLYALSATNLMMLVALGFVLARNIIKLVVERRRGLPFARFRAKLVAVLLGMTLIPAVLVLLVGSELIRTSVQSWFNDPLDQVLSSANAMASDYYANREQVVAAQAERLAGVLAAALDDGPAAVGYAIQSQVQQQAIGLVEVYRIRPGDPVGLELVGDAGIAALPRGYVRDQATRLAQSVATSGQRMAVYHPFPDGGELVRMAMPIRTSPNGPVRGVVIASDHLAGQIVGRARAMSEAYESYQQLRVYQGPLTRTYQSLFLMLTLLILVSATWMGLYLAKRITRPVQALAAAANEIGAGHLDHRVAVEARDEFGSLIDAFNRMADDLAAHRRRMERSAVELERKHHDVEGRRRYVETVLDRIAAGVVSVDPDGRIRTWNSAASRLLGIDARVAGLPVSAVFGASDLQPLAAVVEDVTRTPDDVRPKEVALAREGRELHLAVMASPLRRDDGTAAGFVVVFDDVTPLIRAQKVAAWREVARRLAHEIKNPLTPIQLCAERLRRHFAQAPEATRALVDECTETIVGEVESLKGLVDEFAQFARMPAPRTVPTDLHALLDDTLTLYSGLFMKVQLRRRYASALPNVSVDPDQIRRVVINLIDNAIEAMDHDGDIDIETQHEPGHNLVRITIADNGPGIPAAERDKLFLPYYSTKRRGSGLGLAIVRRIVAEHGGNIEVADNEPRGTRFMIELPA